MVISENLDIKLKNINNIPIVDFWDVQKICGIDTQDIRNYFKNNPTAFVENVDYFVMAKSEYEQTMDITLDRAYNAVRSVILLTKSGYYTLICLLIGAGRIDKTKSNVLLAMDSYFAIDSYNIGEINKEEKGQEKTITELSEIDKLLEYLSFANMYSNSKYKVQIGTIFNTDEVDSYEVVVSIKSRGPEEEFLVDEIVLLKLYFNVDTLDWTLDKDPIIYDSEEIENNEVTSSDIIINNGYEFIKRIINTNPAKERAEALEKEIADMQREIEEKRILLAKYIK